MTDEAGPIFRTRQDELKYNFCKSYDEWIRVSRIPGVFLSSIEAAFQAYCVHRDAWIYGVEYVELSESKKREYRELRFKF